MDYVAYAGAKFTIEWYFNAQGKSSVKDYFEDLSEDRRDKIMQLFQLMAEAGEIRNIQKFRNEGDKIFAFKPKPDRFLSFFIKGKKIIITNAFEKHSQKLPAREKKRALEAREDYLKRTAKGTYYGKQS